MTNILFLIAGIALGFWIKGRSSKSLETFADMGEEEMKEIHEEARKAFAERIEGRKKRILNLMNIEAVHDSELQACGVEDIKKGITSENVQKLLDVSVNTARKYLNELEDEGKIIQNGKVGRGVYYTLK